MGKRAGCSFARLYVVEDQRFQALLTACSYFPKTRLVTLPCPPSPVAFEACETRTKLADDRFGVREEVESIVEVEDVRIVRSRCHVEEEGSVGGDGRRKESEGESAAAPSPPSRAFPHRP
jgi:hypothetical protein